MTVFLLARAFECGNLHSTGISRFIAKPVPVPLRSRRLRTSFHVGSHTRATITQELLRTPGLLHDRCPARCSLRPRGLVTRSPIARTHAWPARGQTRSAVTQNNRSRGYVSDSGHTPFTSLDTHCLSSGSGRLDLPYPGRLLLCHRHILLLNHGSEPG